jgi:hypothetical protein
VIKDVVYLVVKKGRNISRTQEKTRRRIAADSARLVSVQTPLLARTSSAGDAGILLVESDGGGLELERV